MVVTGARQRALIRGANLCARANRGIVRTAVGEMDNLRSSTMGNAGPTACDPGCRPSTLHNRDGAGPLWPPCEVSANADPAGIDFVTVPSTILHGLRGLWTPQRMPFHRPPEHRETSRNGTPSSPFGRI